MRVQSVDAIKVKTLPLSHRSAELKWLPDLADRSQRLHED